MRYLCLIYNDEQAEAARPEAEQQAVMAGYFTFTEDIRQSGVMLGGEALHPVATATTVRVRDGKTLLTDGPFAETREQLGGFYLIEAANLDEAVAVAARIPGATTGSVEVRPVVDFSAEG